MHQKQQSNLHYRNMFHKQQGHANFLANLFTMKKPPASNGTPDPNKKSSDAGGNPNPNKQPDPNDPSNLNSQNKSTNNPLDNYKDLFNMTASSDDAPPSFSLDPTAVSKIAESLNFAGDLDEASIEGLKSGDPKIISEILNRTGRNAYTTLLQHLPALTDKYVSARLEHANKGLGGQVKSTLTKQALDKLAAKNPVVKQQMETIGQQLLQKFPDASPDWIAEQTGNYFVEMARAIKPDAFNDGKEKPTITDPKDISQRPDFAWGSYLTGEQPKT